MTVRPPITRRKMMRKILSSLKTIISILTTKLTRGHILIKKLNLMRMNITMSNYRVFKTSIYSGLAKAVMKYARYKARSSISIKFQNFSKYVFLVATIFVIS
jgi:hypothetical protein